MNSIESAVELWTSNDGFKLNKFDGTVDTSLVKLYEHVLESRLFAETIVYRATEMSTFINDIESDVFTTRGFLSTSRRKSVIDAFGWRGGSPRVIWTITAPANCIALDLDKFDCAFVRGEKEIIFPPGTKIQINEIDDDGDAILINGVVICTRNDESAHK